MSSSRPQGISSSRDEESSSSSRNVEGNMFEYLVESTLQKDRQDISFSSTSTGSRGRQRGLRVKRYTEEGEEVPRPETAPPVPPPLLEGGSSQSSLSVSANGSRRGLVTSRSERMKRYREHPSPKISPGSSDGEEGKSSIKAKVAATSSAALWISNIEASDNVEASSETDEPKIVSEEEEESDPASVSNREEEEVDDNFRDYRARIEEARERQLERIRTAKEKVKVEYSRTEKKDDDDDDDEEYQDYERTVAKVVSRSASSQASNKNVSGDHDDSFSSTGQGMGEDRGAQEEKESRTDRHAAGAMGASKKAQDDGQKQQAAALASAALLQRGKLKSAQDNASNENETNDNDASTTAPKSRSEQDDAAKRQAAALASAAILQKSLLKKAPEKKEEDSVPETSSESTSGRVDMGLSEEQSAEEVRAIRRQVLEQRKRKLEALAKASATRQEFGRKPASVEPAKQMTPPKKTSRDSSTVTIDVYTGEEIGEMPDLNSISRSGGSSTRVGSGSKSAAESSAGMQKRSLSFIASVAEDDKEYSKRRRTCFLIFLMFLVVGGLCIYFGAFFNRGENQSQNGDRSIGASTSRPSLRPTQPPTDIPTRPTQPSTDIPAPVVLPPISTPTPPTVIPMASPTAQTNAPIPVDPLPQPTAAPIPIVPPDDINAALYDELVAEWPLLADSMTDRSSPQFRALEWLSVDDGLESYSTSRKLQRFALATFFFSTNGETWRNNDGWLSSASECIWHTTGADGTQCDAKGSYASLKLNFNDVSGTLPPELALLSSSLISIDLIRNSSGPSISGTLPTALGRLAKLEFLNLSGNELRRSIPTEIGLLTRMRRLQLQDNSLSDQIPTEIGRLTIMRQLELSSNQLTGTLPSEIGNLPILSDFSATSNGLTSIPSEIGNLSNLANLDLSSNQLSGLIPSELGNLQRLVRMNLSSNLLSGGIPSSLGGMASIRDNLDLSSNQLTGTIPAELGRLVLLRQLLLYSNQLSGEVPLSFRSLGRLTTIRLESNGLTGQVPDNVCAVFVNSLPTFVSDCTLDCPCCTHCCDNGACQCLVEDERSLQFLCSAFP